jgi:hypothetical protein
MAYCRALTLTIDGLRLMERHGGSHMLEKAITGCLAIAPPDWKKHWREVFGVNGLDWRYPGSLPRSPPRCRRQ